MSYVRPAIGSQRFVAPDGTVIIFGEQFRDWPNGQPPEEFYSVDPFPERFRALHDVADALVAHLTSTYDVTVSDQTFPEPAADPVRAVTLTPSDPQAAPITLQWTRYPSVKLRAGLTWSDRYPDCGCRACDEPCEVAADNLESDVFAWVEGRFQEYVDRGPDGWRRGATLRDRQGAQIAAGWSVLSEQELVSIRARTDLGQAGYRSAWRAWPPRGR